MTHEQELSDHAEDVEVDAKGEEEAEISATTYTASGGQLTPRA